MPNRISEGPRELDWRGTIKAAEKVAMAQSIQMATNLRPYPALTMRRIYRLAAPTASEETWP